MVHSLVEGLRSHIQSDLEKKNLRVLCYDKSLELESLAHCLLLQEMLTKASYVPKWQESGSEPSSWLSTCNFNQHVFCLLVWACGRVNLPRC